jgi:hypothetical protein
MRRLAIVFAVVSLTPSAYAQRGGPGTAAFTRVNVESDVVKGAPYSAEIVNESIQVLSDGNRIVHRTMSRVYRDSEGRTRRNRSGVGSPEVSITIRFPTTSTRSISRLDSPSESGDGSSLLRHCESRTGS